ncbi:hypothetical protein JI58_03170 [Marinosulfonomonas sp. PRT-SC04]|nr:hypothetical protein JI58_03170 [Marinosulfonomonas sp. PRT-SC04]
MKREAPRSILFEAGTGAVFGTRRAKCSNAKPITRCNVVDGIAPNTRGKKPVSARDSGCGSGRDFACDFACDTGRGFAVAILAIQLVSVLTGPVFRPYPLQKKVQDLG